MHNGYEICPARRMSLRLSLLIHSMWWQPCLWSAAAACLGQTIQIDWIDNGVPFSLHPIKSMDRCGSGVYDLGFWTRFHRLFISMVRKIRSVTRQNPELQVNWKFSEWKNSLRSPRGRLFWTFGLTKIALQIYLCMFLVQLKNCFLLRNWSHIENCVFEQKNVL